MSIFRNSIFRNSDAGPERSVQSATNEAEFAIDLIDMIQVLMRDKPRLAGHRGKFLAVWVMDFSTIVYRGEDPSEHALGRRWERWKSRVRGLGLDVAMIVDWVPDREDELNAPLVLDVKKATDWAETTIASAKQLAETVYRARKRSRSTLVRPARDVSVRAALESLDIQYTPSRLRMWRDRGAPFKAVKHGTRKLYFTSMPELEEWIDRAVQDDAINDPFQERVPIETARPKILAAIERSGLTKSEFAREIETTWGMLESYVMSSSKVRTVPMDIVLRAEQLGALAPGTDLHSKWARKGAPTLSAVRQALKESGGRIQSAARLLKERGFTTGISPENVRYIAKKHEISYVTRALVMPGTTEFRKALVALDFNLTRVAEELGISHASVSRLVDRYGLRGFVEPYLRAPSKADVIDAIGHAGADAAEAGRLLGVSDSRFRSLLSQYGLNEDFARLAERERNVEVSAEHDRLKAELESAVRSGETRNELAARLDMPRTSVESAVRRLRLRDLYNQLPYEVGAKARGATREIGAERVPFWHDALTSLMKRYPEGGGLGMARRLGMARGVSVLPWVKGKRVPRYDMIEKIMAMAGREMPDWRGAIERAAPNAETFRELAEKIGVARHGLYSMLKGHVNPSEKMLERILGEDFWVATP